MISSITPAFKLYLTILVALPALLLSACKDRQPSIKEMGSVAFVQFGSYAEMFGQEIIGADVHNVVSCSFNEGSNLAPTDVTSTWAATVTLWTVRNDGTADGTNNPVSQDFPYVFSVHKDGSLTGDLYQGGDCHN